MRRVALQRGYGDTNISFMIIKDGVLHSVYEQSMSYVPVRISQDKN
jgi:hypothetical protein